ncbi:DUF86 domain-containing protein [Gloeocapsa sp. PCC 73106]|uniref:HepT-like ribonuclease domain-containing protein n=1 Tax=Gloeocapsa sp. PCC 73106 TaxID=102232 RepID=UPI0002AC9C92|nr:HepT-like ribonuclease domain-containing protein [Gloeocapsa sp. PCC 73106]ELR98682.1 hypothetical protein GLO73106DRAFT_00025200 [Gloeocapsa sp. PCC 73106]
MRSDEIRLQDILEAIQQIEFFIATGRENFYQSKLLQSAVLYQLIIIGEAAKDVDPNLRNQYSTIPWQQVSGMRDILGRFLQNGRVLNLLNRMMPSALNLA